MGNQVLYNAAAGLSERLIALMDASVIAPSSDFKVATGVSTNATEVALPVIAPTNV